MKYINLLPREEQKEIKLEKINAGLVSLFIWIIISLLIFAALFLIARFYLSTSSSGLERMIEQQKRIVSMQENKQVKAEVVLFNTHLSNLVTLNDHHARWSEVMIAFARLVPADVAIDSFSADRISGRISISGFAKNRDSVLLLRKNIIDSDFFTNINFPLSNLVKPADINFKYTFYVKNEMLLEKPPAPLQE